MLKKLKQNRKKFIILVSLLAILPIVAFGYLLFSILFPKEDTNLVEANRVEETTSPDVLPLPDDPNAKEEEKTTEVNGTKTTSAHWWEYPSKIYPTTKSGNDLLVLVNKTYKLSSSYAPTDLKDVKQSGIRAKNNGTYLVRKVIINDLKAMNTAAKSAGIDLSVISAYRSYSQQASTYNYWVRYNGGCISCADKVSAKPGHSQHQLGTAIDFSTNQINDALGSAFTNTKAERWLRSNAYKYGFVIAYPKGYETTTGYSYESWHYRYIGVANAQEMKESGKILEVFLSSQ